MEGHRGRAECNGEAKTGKGRKEKEEGKGRREKRVVKGETTKSDCPVLPKLPAAPPVGQAGPGRNRSSPVPGPTPPPSLESLSSILVKGIITGPKHPQLPQQVIYFKAIEAVLFCT